MSRRNSPRPTDLASELPPISYVWETPNRRPRRAEWDKDWQATWGARIIGATTAPAPTVSLPGPVEEALESLTQAINLGTGLNHPSDKKHAGRTIARLRQEGHSFDPVEVRRWAQRNGWSSSAAADLEKVARKATR